MDAANKVVRYSSHEFFGRSVLEIVSRIDVGGSWPIGSVNVYRHPRLGYAIGRGGLFYKETFSFLPNQSQIDSAIKALGAKK